MNATHFSAPAQRSIRKRRVRAIPRAIAVLAMAAAFAAVPAYDAAAADPERRVVSVIDRADIELSGLTGVSELLGSRLAFNSHGLYRPYFGTGSAAIVVNGRNVSGLDFDTLPISAVERIEILDQGPTRSGGQAISGTINVVLRSGYEGTEVSGGVGLPSQEGLDGEHGSALWGGALGSGRITIGVDHIGREEVRDADRAYSRAQWTPGGSFADATGVSSSGNTINLGDLGLRSLGDCDESIYTGVLTHPHGEVCGYAYADIKWLNGYERFARESLFINADHPLGDDADLYVEARAAQGDSAFRYAPSVGSFEFAPEGDVRTNIIENVDGLTEENLLGRDDDSQDADEGLVRVFHRFVGHGNRDWLTDIEEQDFKLGVQGQLYDGLGYDVHVQYYRREAVETGNTFVSESLVRDAIESGRYDIVNPLSTDSDHQAAIRETALRLTRDTVDELRSAGAVLEGTAFTMPGGAVRWTAGFEAEDENRRNVYDYRDSENRSHEATDVLGSGGNSVVGERERLSTMAEASVPLVADWTLTLGARRDDYDDVGEAGSWRMAHHYRLDDTLAFHASWTGAATPPSLASMHLPETFIYPYVCDPAPPNCEQFKTLTGGNPSLKPDKAERINLGATAEFGAYSVGADWFAVEHSDRPARVDTQVVVDQDRAGNPLAGTRVVRRGGHIDYIVNPIVQAGESEDEGIALHAGAAWEIASVDVALDIHALHTTRHEVRVAGLDQPGDTPRNRVHASLRASWDNVTASWTAYAVSSQSNNTETGRFKGWQGHDLAVRWVDPLGVNGLRLVGGVLNVADRGPSIDPTGSEDPLLRRDSVRGRTFFLNATMAW